MNVDETAAFRARLAEQLAQLDTRYRGAATEFGGYHEAAAVLASFRPGLLQPSGLARAEEDVEDVLDNSVLEAKPDGANAWLLKSEVRIAVLRQLGTRERMLQALAANPERLDSPVQRMFEAYLKREAPPLHTQDLAQLTASHQVVRWLHPVVEDVPDVDSVAARIELATLLRPFDELAGTHFSGRRAELEQLRRYVEAVPTDSSSAAIREWLQKGVKEVLNLHEKPPLMIFGPGGMGKSSLLGRFILDHTRLEHARRIPFIYLDFDRPELRADEPVTFLVEAVRQLGLQNPAAREACERLRAAWQDRLAGAARQRSAASQTKQASTPRLDREPFLDGFRTLLGTLDLARKPILFVLDTFEEVQYRSPAGVREVMGFLAALQVRVPRLRVVIAGRAPVAGEATEPLALGELDVEAAQAFLQKRGVTDPEIARRLATKLGGNPLTLRLAAEVVAREGVGAVEAGDAVDQLAVQRQLFRRILRRIHDPDVRKLAHPGLVLRLVTADLIQQVLAGPCEIPVPDTPSAERLFNELKREIAVVASSDATTVRHRPELRRIMLPLLERDRPQTVAEIHRLAVAYYLAKDDVISRGEEIYHRLSLGQDTRSIEARWLPGVEAHLGGAIEDLKPAQRAYLASRLGVEADEASLAAASLADWERDAERRMRDWLAHRKPQDALTVFGERTERRPGTVLDLLAAEASEQLGDHDGAIATLERALGGAAEAGNADLHAELLLGVARLHINAGHGARAHEALDQALKLSTSRGPVHQLEVLALRAELARRSDPAHAQSALGAVRLELTTLDDAQLRSVPGVLRLIASQLTPEDAPLLARIVRLAGFETITPQQRNALGLALAAWDADWSASVAEPPGTLARSIGLRPGERLSETWLPVSGREPGELAAMVATLLEKYPLPAAGEQARLAMTNAVIAALGGLPAPIPEAAGSEPPPRTEPPREARPKAKAKGRTDIRLSGKQVQNLQRTLADIFPTIEPLQQLLRFSLNKELSTISLASNIQEATFDLVVTAQAEGWTADLLIAALNAAPGDARLQALASELSVGSVAPSRRDLERIVQRSAGFLDINQWRSRLGELEAQVCRIEMANVMATGFLVAPDLVLTVFHALERVIESSTPPELICRFDYRRLPDGRTFEGTVFRLSPSGWLVDHSPYHPSDALPDPDDHDPPADDFLDYALLRLEGYPGAAPVGRTVADATSSKRGWIDVPRDGAMPDPGSPVYILQHPQGEPLKLAFETDGIIGLNPNGTRLWYRANTLPGSAGAPCFSESWLPIAMHHSSRSERTRKEGIPLSAIVRRLERRGLLASLGGRGIA